jgi:Invasion associated locus B (IalB) protein
MTRSAPFLATLALLAATLSMAAPASAQTAPAATTDKKAAKPAAPAKTATPAKAAAAAAAKPADGKPNQVASFGDWGVYQAQGAKGRVCYTLAQPKERIPSELKRDPAYAFISDRPGEGVRNEISFIMGFEVAGAGADAPSAGTKAAMKEAVATVGDQNFELLAKTANLWVKNAAKESQLIDEMKKGAKLQVKAASKKGNVTTDSYSLAGFSQALDRVQKDCPPGAH